jgi:hypothetical protein
MALWGFIPAKHIEKVGGLPSTARRLDTGQWVDLEGREADRTQACGWWNLDEPDVPALTAQNHLTPQELAVLAGERTAALFDRDQKRLWLGNAKEEGLAAITALIDKLDGLDNPPAPTDSVNGLIYLYNRAQFTDRILAGGGTFEDPGLVNLVILLAEYLLLVIEQTPGLELP